MDFKFHFFFTVILVGTLVLGSAFAEESKVAPALPTAVSADPFYWGEGGFFAGKNMRMHDSDDISIGRVNSQWLFKGEVR